MLEHLRHYQKVQGHCESILDEIKKIIQPGKSELDLVNECFAIISSHGITDFWYHGVPAIIAIGEHTSLSLSGKDYVPSSDNTLQEHDFLTIDLSLAIDHYWGIRARSFYIENGVMVNRPFCPMQSYIEDSIRSLHQYLKEIAEPDMTFHDLYHFINEKVMSLNLLHLDFKHNFGHSIEKKLEDRVYIADGIYDKITPTTLFSFEPHLKEKNSFYGVKDADIYYFDKGRAKRVRELG